jgi:bidirectional [NiFe] hydrogenase diaphorase subunit
MTPDDLERVTNETRMEAAGFDHKLRVCVAASCLSMGSDRLRDALGAEVQQRGLEHRCAIKGVGCLGLCSLGPLVAVDAKNETSGVLYQNVVPNDAPEIIEHLGREPIERLACPTDIPFFTGQQRIVLENVGLIDPERLEDAIAAGGYAALLECLGSRTPAKVIDEIVRSGLRGRGGAGYPTGLKWSTVAKSSGERKFVICNADEGDPGAYMDRSVLESDPHRVLEGMAIAAYAVGANRGYIYVRAEYPLAVSRLKTAIRQAERAGLLGSSIGGTPFSFSVDIRLGAGAFVCGEETALIASIEGGRGTPRPRPPYPAEHGLWGMPTLINNVETFANVPAIIRNGAAWFAGIGTERSKGTKVFALAGKINHTGLIEVPMGTSLREIVLEMGGGIPNDGPNDHAGKKTASGTVSTTPSGTDLNASNSSRMVFKAVQTGGPSGGCIPAAHLDTPVDYESLIQLGSFMGSGGMIVADSGSCAVDLAKYFMEFCMSESCGKCVPCRVGTVQMHAILEKISRFEASLDDLARLEELCDLVRHTSLCGLGQGAPNPVMSTLRFFREEYLAHINQHHCPAGVCGAHTTHAVNAEEAMA